MPAIRTVLLTCCLGGLTGCAGAVRTAAETAVPIVVDSGLGELATPKSQAQLKSIAASPAVQEAGYGVGLGIGRGMLDEGTAFLGGSASKSDEPPPAVGVAATNEAGGPGTPTANAPTTRVAAASKPATTAATGPATRPTGPSKGVAFLQANLTPAVGGIVRSAVSEGMGQATGPAGLAQIHAAAESGGDGLVTGMARAAGRDGPAVAAMVRSALAGGINQVTGPAGLAQLHAVAEAAGDGFVTGMTRAADRDASPVVQKLVRDRVDPILDDVARRLGPALHDVLQDEVRPVVRDLIDECVRDTLKMPVRPENSPDVVANARNVSEGASQVTHEALVEFGVLTPDGRWSAKLRLALWGGGGLLALLGAAALVLLCLRIGIAWSEWRRGRAGPVR